MIAFDSNVLIYFLNAHPEFGPKAKDLLSRIEQTGGFCSSLAITEAMHGNIARLEHITPLGSPQILILDVTQRVAELAGQLKIIYGLKNVDAIHIATALTGGAKEFVTNDQVLLKKKVKGLKIRGL